MGRGTVALVVAGAVMATAAPAHAAGSLYDGPGHRPGPKLLYAPEAVAPQLQNVAPFRAAPILVSGASAYRGGEFLYQDYLYDDHGARLTPDPSDARLTKQPFSLNNGTLTYPNAKAYAHNAADLVELRILPQTDRTLVRLTLNTMLDPKLVAASLALGGRAGTTHPFPAGANVSAPADRFVTVHAKGDAFVVDVADAVSGQALAPGSATVDLQRRQITIAIPRSDWDPAATTQRVAAGVGLWDNAAQRYLVPGASASDGVPGGAGVVPGPAAFFNVAFRSQEPLPDITSLYSIAADPAWWRDKQQGAALAAHDISGFHADVDFGKLAAKADDESGVPRTGALNRILPSHFETAQGTDPSETCAAEPCPGPYLGRLQPYAIYVPDKPQPPRGFGLTLLMHALFTNYNMYAGSFNQSQLGERGRGSIVITPEARGPDGGYTGYALADVFDVWNDVARRYHLDPDWSAATGYSMGAIGTFEIAEMYSDLFGAAQSTSGADATGETVSLRNVPMLMWNMVADEEVTPDKYLPTIQKLDDLGYEYEADLFAPGEHNTFAVEDQFAPVAAWLAERPVPRNPARVTYAISRPDLDVPSLDLDPADHAYWLEDIKARVRGGVPPVVDAVTSGLGKGEGPVGATQRGAATLSGGHFPFPVLAYTRQYRTRGPASATARADKVTITATNIASVTINAARAGLSCHPQVVLNSDGPTAVRFTGCPRPARCARTVTLKLPKGARRVSARVGGRPVKVTRRGTRVRVRVSAVRGRRATVRLRVRLRGGTTRTLTRHVRAC